MKRPIAVSAVSLISGILLSEWIPSFLWGLIAVALVCLAMYFIYRRLAGYSPFLLMALPFMLAGFMLHMIQTQSMNSRFSRWEGLSVEIEGYILDEPLFTEGRTVFTMEAGAVSAQGEKTPLRNARIKVSIYSDIQMPDLRYGSHIKVFSPIRIPPGQRNMGGFDYKRFLAARGISGTCNINPQQLSVLDGRKSAFLKEAGYSVRKGILASLYGSMPRKEAAVAAGMLIGYTEDMPESMQDSFRVAGLSHIMAVSGANIAFLLFPLLWLLQRMGLSKRWSSAISLPIMLFYVFATGMEASVVRAAIMAGVTLAGMIIFRQTDFFCSMAVSVILILLSNTFMLFDAGFMLSYAAVLSLAVFYKPVFDKLPAKIPKFARDALTGSFSAQLGVIPVIAGTFNTFSVVSVFANLIIVPVTGVLTAVTALVSLFWFIIRPLGSLLGSVAAFMTDLILAVTQAISRIPWAEIRIATPGFLLVVGYYLILFTIRYGKQGAGFATENRPLSHRPSASRPLRRFMTRNFRVELAAMLTLYGCMVLLTLIPPGKLEIYFTDVNQGDSCLIKTPSGANILIDGGGSLNDGESSYTGEMVVVPLLYDMKAAGIDVMVATHSHADHIAGLKSVIDAMPVKRLIIADVEDSGMKELIDYAEQKNIRVERANRSDILYSEENLRLTAVYPFEDKSDMPSIRITDANDLSLVTRLDYGKFSALFTGDIGTATEGLILSQEAVDCDLLKVAHHGSKYSSSVEFIDNASPAVAVISVGTNRYGHPDPGVEKMLADKGIKLFETIRDGGILVEANKDNPDQITVRTVVK